MARDKLLEREEASLRHVRGSEDGSWLVSWLVGRWLVVGEWWVSFWGRGGEGPDAGKKSGGNAALDRPAPCKGKRTASVQQQGAVARGSGRNNKRTTARAAARGSGKTASVQQQGAAARGSGKTASVRQQVGARQRRDSQKGTTALTGVGHSLDWGWPQPSQGDTTALVDLRFSVPWGDGR